MRIYPSIDNKINKIKEALRSLKNEAIYVGSTDGAYAVERYVAKTYYQFIITDIHGVKYHCTTICIIGDLLVRTSRFMIDDVRAMSLNDVESIDLGRQEGD